MSYGAVLSPGTTRPDDRRYVVSFSSAVRSSSTRGVMSNRIAGVSRETSRGRTFRGAKSSSASDWMNPLIEKLNGFVLLHPNWNSYGAQPPNGLAVYQATEFIYALSRGGLVPTRASPSAVGGVGMTVKRGQFRAYVEFYNDGIIYRMFSDGISEPSTRPVRTENRGLDDLVAEIRQYLNA